MRVIALRRRPAYGTIGHVERVYGKEQLDEFLAQCHVLVICAPLTPETHAMLGATQFAQLPKGAVVVNVGRAKIIDTDALIAALHSGHLGGASLDVFPQEPLPPEHPLWKTPNVILTPHTSGFRQGTGMKWSSSSATTLIDGCGASRSSSAVEPELGVLRQSNSRLIDSASVVARCE